MSDVSEPTPGEIMRRLDEVSRQLVELASQMREDRNAAAATFLPRELWIESRKSDHAVVADLAGDLKAEHHARIADVKAIHETRAGDQERHRRDQLAIAGIAIGALVAIAASLIPLLVR